MSGDVGDNVTEERLADEILNMKVNSEHCQTTQTIHLCTDLPGRLISYIYLSIYNRLKK